jgi:hypothetical protein
MIPMPQSRVNVHDDFHEDLVRSNKTMKVLLDKIMVPLGWIKNYDIVSGNFKFYDVNLTLPDDNLKTAEVKEDFACFRFGNWFIEYGRVYPGGIYEETCLNVTAADWYICMIHTPSGVDVYVISTEKLCKYIKDNNIQTRISTGKYYDSLGYAMNWNTFKNSTIYEAKIHLTAAEYRELTGISEEEYKRLTVGYRK